MLASIHPLGERARNRRFGATVSAYLAGSVMGAASVGALLGQAGAWFGDAVGPAPAAVAGAAAAACAVGLALDLQLRGLRLPTPRRQVDKSWLDTYRGWVYGLGFGFQLGLGVVTVVNTAAVYVMLALALLSASPAGGMAVGATFGIVRGTMILMVANVRRPEQLREVLRRMQSWELPSQRAGVAVLSLTAIGVAVAALQQ